MAQKWRQAWKEAETMDFFLRTFIFSAFPGWMALGNCDLFGAGWEICEPGHIVGAMAAGLW